MDEFDNLNPDLEAALAAADRLVEQRRRSSLQGSTSMGQAAPPVPSPGAYRGPQGRPSGGPVGSTGWQASQVSSVPSPGRQARAHGGHVATFSVQPQNFYGTQAQPTGHQTFSPGRNLSSQGSPSRAPVGSPGRRGGLKVTVSAFEDGRIIARSAYNESVKNVCKSIEGRQFHADVRGWSFPADGLATLITSLSGLPGVQVDLTPPLQYPPELRHMQTARAPLSPPSQRPLSPSAASPPQAVGIASPGASSHPSLHVKLVTKEATQPSQEPRFAAQFKYSEHVVAACRKVTGRYWDPALKEWTFPLSSFSELLQRLSTITEQGVYLTAEPPLRLPSDLPPNAAEVPPVAANRAQNAPPSLNVETVAAIRNIASVAAGQNSDTLAAAKPPLANVQRLLFQDDPAPATLNSSQGGATTSSNSTPEGPLPSPPKRKVELTLGIYSRDRVSVQFGFDQSVQGAVKAVKGAVWSQGKRVWHLPLQETEALQASLEKLPNVDVHIVSLPPLVERAMRAASKTAEEAKERNDLARYEKMLGEDLKRRLMQFQREGIQWALQQGGRVFIADEMGLGKTVQALAFAACYGEAWPILILVPSSLRFTWAKMCVDWLHVASNDITVVVSSPSRVARAMGYNLVSPATSAKGGGSLRLEGQVNILSYDILPKIQRDLAATNFKLVICDESHYMKNPAAQRTLCASPLVQRAQYAMLLSGTPALSRPIELQQQLAALLPAVYKDRAEYGGRYCQGGRQFFPGQEYMGASNLKELHTLLMETVMIRRQKADVLQQLPAKLRQQVFLDVPDKAMAPVRKVQDRLAAARATAAAADDERALSEERAMVNELYRTTGVAKTGPVQDHIQMMLEHDHKFLIFAHHKEVMDTIEVTLKKWSGRDNEYIRIDGSTPPANRTELVARFQEEPRCKVALLSIKAAGVGLTLHAAQTVVFAELSWLPGDLLQAEDRCHRIGQKASVNVLYLLAQETSDDIMWESVGRKLENVGEVLNGAHDQLSVDQQHRQKSGQATIGRMFANVNAGGVNKRSEDGVNAGSVKMGPEDDTRLSAEASGTINDASLADGEATRVKDSQAGRQKGRPYQPTISESFRKSPGAKSSKSIHTRGEAPQKPEERDSSQQAKQESESNQVKEQIKSAPSFLERSTESTRKDPAGQLESQADESIGHFGGIDTGLQGCPKQQEKLSRAPTTESSQLRSRETVGLQDNSAQQIAPEGSLQREDPGQSSEDPSGVTTGLHEESGQEPKMPQSSGQSLELDIGLRKCSGQGPGQEEGRKESLGQEPGLPLHETLQRDYEEVATVFERRRPELKRGRQEKDNNEPPDKVQRRK